MAELLSAAGSFATEGERRAAEVLKQLPDAWLVICNKTLSTSNGRSFEMDFVVVGKRWVFLLDEKSWRGRIRGNDEQWVRSDGSSERSPLAKVDYVTKVLAGHLNWRIPALKEALIMFVVVYCSPQLISGLSFLIHEQQMAFS